MDNPPPSQYGPEESYPAREDKKGLAVFALALGILSLCAWLLPLCGFILGITGLILGILALRSSRRTMAVISIVFCGFALGLSLVNALGGAAIGITNSNFINNLIQSL